MRNVRDFPPADREGLRLGDRMRFLFLGGAYKRRFAARAAQHGIVFSSRQPSHRFLFAAGVAMLAAVLLTVGWLGGQLREARIRNQAMAADLRALRQRSAGRQAEQTALPQTALPQIAPPQIAPPQINQPAPRGHADEAALQARADLEQALAGSREDRKSV